MLSHRKPPLPPTEANRYFSGPSAKPRHHPPVLQLHEPDPEGEASQSYTHDLSLVVLLPVLTISYPQTCPSRTEEPRPQSAGRNAHHIQLPSSACPLLACKMPESRDRVHLVPCNALNA